MDSKTSFFIEDLSQCRDCYYYRKDLSDCAIYTELKNPCDRFSRMLTSRVSVSLQSVLDILGCIRRVPLADLEFCFDSSRDPKNHDRDKLLLLASELITDDFTKVHPEFFHNYLKTLQPFMFKECLQLRDACFQGYTAFVFNYPCGSHFIQIKVFVKGDTVEMISFHKSGDRFADIRKFLLDTSEQLKQSGLMICLQERFDLYLAWEHIDDIACTHKAEGLWGLAVDDFMEQFQQKTLAVVKSMLTDLMYQITLVKDANIEVCKKITIYNTLPISELLRKDDVSDKGLIAALVSARLIANLDLLDASIVEKLSSQPDVQELNAWLNEYHLFQGDISRLILKGG